LKEDDPSARIILEGSFGLHAKKQEKGSTFHLVYMQDLCSARLQRKMAGDNDKSVVLGVLLSLLALITAFSINLPLYTTYFKHSNSGL